MMAELFDSKEQTFQEIIDCIIFIITSFDYKFVN